MTSSAAPTMSPLISAEALAHCLAQGDQASSPSLPQAAEPAPKRVLLDCRFSLPNPQAGEAAFAQSRLPGARYAHLDRDLSAPPQGTGAARQPHQAGRHPLPDIATFAHTLRQWGIGPGTHVVAYDDAGGMFAARLWWMLRWLGHDAVQVLDGGWAAWLALPGPLETTPPRAPTASWAAEGQGEGFTPQPRAQGLLDTHQVLADLAHPARQLLIDARAPDRFRGENETLDPVGGHIPGARNRFFQLNLQQPNGLFKPAASLRQEFTELLQGQALDTVVHQCGSGVTACHNLLAMAHAGLHGSRLYAGSWSAWCADPARPVARD